MPTAVRATPNAPLPPGEASRLLATADARLLDVRTPGEFAACHIAGAHHLPLDLLEQHAAEVVGAVDRELIVICQSGQRAARAELLLRQRGGRHLRVVAGGMNGWLAEGLPVIRGRSRMSLERQVRIAAGFLAALGGLLALLVHPYFAALPLAVGSGLIFAGVTDSCAMGMALARLPYNRTEPVDPAAALRALAGSGTA